MADAIVCEPSRFPFIDQQVSSLDVSGPLLLGERVVWIHDDNLGPEHGTVRWIGKLPEMGQDWVAGVELDNPAGKTDGRWGYRQLFLTKPKHGLIIPVMGLIKEDEFVGSSQISALEQEHRGLPPDPPGWYDNIEYHNAHKAKRESQFWKRLRSKKSGKSDGKKRQPQPESAALQVAASIAAGDVPTAVTPRSRAKTQTVRSDLGVEMDKWYEATDFSGVRQRKKKSNTLAGSSSVKSFDDTEVSSLASYGTATDESSGKFKGGFLSFFKWLRPKKSVKKKSSSPYLPSPSLSEGTRVKSGSVHSVTSTSSSFQYVAMDFSQSRSVSNAPTLEAKPLKGSKVSESKVKKCEEKQHNDGMKSVVDELRVKLTPSSNNAVCKNDIKNDNPDLEKDNTDLSELQTATKLSDLSSLDGKDKAFTSADEILADADYENVSPLPKARGVCVVRRKKRRAPPPPPILLKSGISCKKTEGGSAKSAAVSPSPGQKRAHVKGKRRAPSPPLQSTPKPWARVKDGKKSTSTTGIESGVKGKTENNVEERAEGGIKEKVETDCKENSENYLNDTAGSPNQEKSNHAVEPTVIANKRALGINSPKMADAETNTTLFRSVEKVTTAVSTSTNTTLVRPQGEDKMTPLNDRSCNSQISSKYPLTSLGECGINKDMPFCDEEIVEVGPAASVSEVSDLTTKKTMGPCKTCGEHWQLLADKDCLLTSNASCPNCVPNTVCAGQIPHDQPLPVVPNCTEFSADSGNNINQQDDEDVNMSNPFVTEEWKEAPRSTQNLISMFNAMSHHFEADKWHVPGGTAAPTAEPEKLVSGKSPSSISENSADIAITKEVHDDSLRPDSPRLSPEKSETHQKDSSPSSTSGSTTATTIIEELDDEKWLANVDAEFARLSDAYLQPADKSAQDDITHEMTFSEICSNSSFHVSPEPSTGCNTPSQESVISNSFKTNCHEEFLSKDTITKSEQAKQLSSAETVQTSVASNSLKAGVHGRVLPKDQFTRGELAKTSSAELSSSTKINNFKADVYERTLSNDSIAECELPKTWSSAESFEDARDTMTPSMEEYPHFERMSSKNGNVNEESTFSVKERESKPYEVNNPVYSNIPLAPHSKPIPKPRYSEMAKPVASSNIYGSHVLYQNVFPVSGDGMGKGVPNLHEHTKSEFDALYANYPPHSEVYAPETPDLLRKKNTLTYLSQPDDRPTYANVNNEWQAHHVGEKKSMHPVDCEMFHEEKRMQSRMKMNRRIFKEAKSRNRSSSQESEPGSSEANHTAEASSFYRRNRSVSASSSSSPILSSASSVSSALNSPPALPKKIGPIRERRRRSHPVPATISEDGPLKPVKNRSHVRENSGLTTLPTRMPSASIKSSSSVEDIDENKGILVGSLLLQIGSKDGPQPSGLSLVTGSNLPRDSGNSGRAPIPIPDKKNRKKNPNPSAMCNIVANPVELNSPKDTPHAVVMRRRKDHSGAIRFSEQRRTVGHNLPEHCSNNTPGSAQVSDEHEYYNIRVHTGEGCKLQVRRAHTLDSKSSSSGHHHHHHHRQNPRGREKKGRLQKSFASVAADSPLGKVKSESRVSESEWDDMSLQVTTPDCHSLTPTNSPLSPHPLCTPGCDPAKYQRSFSDPDPISLSQNEPMHYRFQKEYSRLQGSRPGKTSTQSDSVSAVIDKRPKSGVPPKSLPHSNGEKLNSTVLRHENPNIRTSNSHSSHQKENVEYSDAHSPRHAGSANVNQKPTNVHNKNDLNMVYNKGNNKLNETRDTNSSQLPPTGVSGRLTCKLSGNVSLTTNNDPLPKVDKPIHTVNCPRPQRSFEETLSCKIQVNDNISHQLHQPQQLNRQLQGVNNKPSSPKSPPHFNHSPSAATPKTATDSSRQKPATLANNSLLRSPKMLKAEPEKLPAVVAPDGFHPSSSVALVCEQVKLAGRLWPASYEILAPELLRLRSKLSGVVNGSHQEEISDDTNTLEVNKLLRKLEVSICTGHIDEAAVLARKLAMLKVNCSVIRNKPRVENSASEEICLNLFVEDRTSHIGPINLYVNPSMTVGDLKKKIENNFDFPSNLQRWILGKKLASDDNVPLSDFDIRTSGCPVFLYLMTSDQDIAKAYKERLESYLKALEELDQDTSSDEGTSNDQEEPNNVSGDNTRPGGIPTEQQNGHHVELRKKQSTGSNVSSQAKHPDNPFERLYAGARPKQTSSVSQNQDNAVKKEEGWNCPACTMFNVPTRPGCVMCTTPRPDNYVVPKEYVPKPEEQERLLKERQLELELEQTREKERLENYQRLLEIDNMDVVVNDQAFECPVCFTDIDVGEGVRVRDCLHVFCRECLARSVEYSETAEVKCPFRDDNYSCTNVLQHREIQALVTQEVYDRYLQKSVTTAESQAENSFHCKTTNCPAWCLFEDNINQFACPICSHVNCLTCQAIHEGLNCQQYQDKVNFESQTNDEARKTKEALDEMLAKGQAMRCPKCFVILMKKWGCDWICCSMCKTEICWVTKGPRWGPAGQGDTSAGCRCGVNGVRCHTQCNYCH